MGDSILEISKFYSNKLDGRFHLVKKGFKISTPTVTVAEASRLIQKEHNNGICK